MNSRLRNTTIAIILATIGSLILASYFNALQAKIEGDAEPVAVFVAKTAIPAGTGSGELLLRLEKQNIPRKFIAADAISNEAEVKNATLVIALSAGEQLTKNNLRRDAVSEISYRLTADKVAISIAVDEVVGVAGHVKAGDRVALIAAFSPGPGGGDVSQVLLKDVEVLASAASDLKEGKLAASGAKKTLTLAVLPQEAEKIVFAAEKGKIWVTLLPASGASGVNTSGQTMETIFR